MEDKHLKGGTCHYVRNQKINMSKKNQKINQNLVLQNLFSWTRNNFTLFHNKKKQRDQNVQDKQGTVRLTVWWGASISKNTDSKYTISELGSTSDPKNYNVIENQFYLAVL